MDKMREDFEAWWEQWFGEPPMSGWEAIWCGEGYNAEDIDHMWDAWQASRKAIVITAPPFVTSRAAIERGYTVDYSNGHGDAMDAYELVLKEAGITIKGEE